MKRKLYRRAAGLALASMLAFSATSPTVIASSNSPSTKVQASQNQTVANKVLGKVNLDRPGYIELKDVTMLANPSGKTVSFKTTIHNDGNSDISLIDYWVYLRTKAGSKSSVKLIPEDASKDKVPAKSSVTLTYYVQVGSNVKLSDLQFQFIKFDFSLVDFERSLGTINVPATYTDAAPAGQMRYLATDNTTVTASIDRYYLGQSEKYHRPNLTLKLENIGNQSFSVPAYQFQIVSAEGLTYPLTARGNNNLVLTPRTSEEIQLTGSIPKEVDMKGAKLYLSVPIAESNISIPVAAFILPDYVEQTGGAIGTEYTFSTDSGDYHAVMNSIHRLPMDDNDLLTTNITITNKGPETVTIPNFTGKFILDDNVELDANAIIFDKVIGIKPRDSISIQLYASIPYTYEFSEVKVILQEKDEDEAIIDLFEVIHNTNLSPIPTIALGESHTLDVIGQRADVSVRKVHTFDGRSDQIFSVQINAENLEKRFTNIASLSAYFETEDGLLYPSNVEISEDKVSPGGKALINLWQQLPKNIDTSKLKLVVGEAVVGEDGKLTGVYVNPVAYELPEEDKEVKSDLKNIEIYPYTISISKIRTQINYDSGQVLATFDYELSRDSLVTDQSDQHKLVLEISDENGEIKFSKAFDLTGQQALEIGNHSSEFDKIDREFVYKIQTIKHYDFNVYHQFNNEYKKLIASKKIRWFTTTD